MVAALPVSVVLVGVCRNRATVVCSGVEVVTVTAVTGNNRDACGLNVDLLMMRSSCLQRPQRASSWGRLSKALASARAGPGCRCINARGSRESKTATRHVHTRRMKRDYVSTRPLDECARGVAGGQQWDACRSHP